MIPVTHHFQVGYVRFLQEIYKNVKSKVKVYHLAF